MAPKLVLGDKFCLCFNWNNQGTWAVTLQSIWLEPRASWGSPNYTGSSTAATEQVSRFSSIAQWELGPWLRTWSMLRRWGGGWEAEGVLVQPDCSKLPTWPESFPLWVRYGWQLTPLFSRKCNSSVCLRRQCLKYYLLRALQYSWIWACAKCLATQSRVVLGEQGSGSQSLPCGAQPWQEFMRWKGEICILVIKVKIPHT